VNKNLVNSKELEEHEESRKRILEEYPNMPEDILEFVLSLPIEEKKIPKVSDFETEYAIEEQQQQEEMERILKRY
jgi:hypothetical protein